MLKQFVYILFITLCDGFIYHSHIAINQPYMVNFQKKSSKDIKIIDDQDAYRLASFWYGEMKYQQEVSINNDRQRIECLYRENNEEYEKMSNMMSFYYDFEKDKEKYTEYLIWKPKISPSFIDNNRQNSIFYPSFRQTMCIVSFQCMKNDICIENMIYTPFWKGDVNIIKKKLKALLIDYFVDYLKHREIHFES